MRAQSLETEAKVRWTMRELREEEKEEKTRGGRRKKAWEETGRREQQRGSNTSGSRPYEGGIKLLGVHDAMRVAMPADRLVAGKGGCGS